MLAAQTRGGQAGTLTLCCAVLCRAMPCRAVPCMCAVLLSSGGTGLPNSKWSDTGGDSWEGDETEAYAMFLAFASIIHNDINVRHVVALWLLGALLSPC